MYLRSFWCRFSSAAIGLTLGVGLTVGTPRPGHTLTFELDFVSGPTTDIFNVGTTTANFAPYGFRLNLPEIQAGALAAVNNDFLGYPTLGANANSPLPNGKQLNINFEVSTALTAPVNGDSEYYYVAIGTNTTGNSSLFGQACQSCVRMPFLTGPSVPNHSVLGSILTDRIATLAGLASTDAARINLLVETISHEIGHTLSLVHPPGPEANPGASIYTLMSVVTAPTNQPDSERIKDQAFSYSEFGTLIDSVGLRDAAPVPGAIVGSGFPGMVLAAIGIFSHHLGGDGGRRSPELLTAQPAHVRLRQPTIAGTIAVSPNAIAVLGGGGGSKN